MPSESQPPSGCRQQGRSNTKGSSVAPSSTGATAGSSRSSSVVGQPNTQQQPAQAVAGQADRVANGNGAGNGAGGNGGGNGGGNRAADLWDPPLPGANGFGNSSPGEGFGGPSRRYTYVEPTSPRSTGRPVVHNYPNGAAYRSAANGALPPGRN